MLKETMVIGPWIFSDLCPEMFPKNSRKANNREERCYSSYSGEHKTGFGASNQGMFDVVLGMFEFIFVGFKLVELISFIF